jgi:photosystem II stability/assembly factor-like uncharacterized protein
MRSIYTKALLFTFFQLLLFVTYAQTKLPAEVEQRLKGKEKFYEIKDIIETHFMEQMNAVAVNDEKKIKGINRDRKKWNRWFHESESRLNANGEVENAAKKIFEYLNRGQQPKTIEQRSSSIISTSSIAGNWQLAGPTNVSSGIGRINRIACDPANALTLYAGSAAGGLFKTTSGGVSWSSVSSFIPSLGISGIVVSHNNSNELYILTGDGDAWNSRGLTFKFGFVRYSVGVLKSTDGGNSWYKTGGFPGISDDYVGFKLVQNPVNANELLAATSQGLFRTTNGGASWSLSDLGFVDNRRVFDIEYKPGSGSVVYCTAGDGDNAEFYRSENGGTSFSWVNLGINGANRIEIAVTPANSSYVYLLCGPGFFLRDDNSNDHFKGLFRSTDDGKNFALRSNSPDILGYDDLLNTFAHQSEYDLALAVSPTNEQGVYAGGLVVWRSTNGGTDWNEVVDYYEDPFDNTNYIHPDVHDLVFNPLNGNLYAATDGGVAVSSDRGINWTRLYSGLSCSQFYHFSMQDDGGNIWGGTQDNGILVKNGSSSSFTNYAFGDGYDVLADVAPAGNHDDKYYSVNEKVYADATIDEEITPEGLTEDDFFANLAMCPTNEDIIYAGYERLFISYDRGSDWEVIYNNRTEPVPGNWCIEACPSSSAKLYAAGRYNGKGLLHRLDNFGFARAVNLTNALEDAGYNGSSKITDIAVHPTNSNRVWVTVGGFVEDNKVYYTSDGGTTWDNISDGLPNLPTNCALADASGNVYVGTDIGVYYRGSGANDWTPFYNDLPRVPVTEMEFLAIGGINMNIYASTYGRGIWVSSVYSDCPSSLTINQNLQGQQFYQASTTINSTSLINGVAGTDVFFKAGTDVTLIPGFRAVAGTEFKAYIGPCNNDIPEKIIALPLQNEKNQILKQEKP